MAIGRIGFLLSPVFPLDKESMEKTKAYLW